MNEKHERILVVTAVPAERDAVRRGLSDNERFDVRDVGFGSAIAAANTAIALAAGRYGLVVCAGIAGGFAGRADIGQLVVASEIIAADLGAETAEGFRSADELGFGSARFPVHAALAERVCAALAAAGVPVRSGPVVTVSTATGTQASAAELERRVPGATAEAMEGFGVAAAAHACGVPVLELRAVSNRVGPRDRSAWRIEEALHTLQASFATLAEVLV